MGADFADSFASALNQGLGIMRSFRDEKRLNDEIERQKKKDALYEEIAREQLTQSRKNFEQQQQLFPLQLKTAQNQAEITGVSAEFARPNAEADLTGKRIQNRANAVNVETAGLNNQVTRLQLKAAQAALANEQTLDNFTQFWGAANSGNINSIKPEQLTAGLQMLGMTGAIQNVSRVQEMIAKRDYSWAADRGIQRDLAVVFAPEAAKTAPRGVIADTAQPSKFEMLKNGNMRITNMGYDNAGKVVTWTKETNPALLFQGLDLKSAVSTRLRQEGNLEDKVLAAFAQQSPKKMRELTAAAQSDLNERINKLEDTLSKQTPGSPAYKETERVLNQYRTPAYQGSYIKQKVVSALGYVGNRVSGSESALTAVQALGLPGTVPFEQRVQTTNQVLATMRGWMAPEQMAAVAKQAGVNVSDLDLTDPSNSDLVKLYTRLDQTQVGRSYLIRRQKALFGGR